MNKSNLQNWREALAEEIKGLKEQIRPLEESLRSKENTLHHLTELQKDNDEIKISEDIMLASLGSQNTRDIEYDGRPYRSWKHLADELTLRVRGNSAHRVVKKHRPDIHRLIDHLCPYKE